MLAKNKLSGSVTSDKSQLKVTSLHVKNLLFEKSRQKSE